MRKSPEHKAVTALLWISILFVLTYIGLIYLGNRQEQVKEGEEVDRREQVAREVLTNTPVRGPLDASVTILEFGDFECASCKAAAPVLDKVLAAYPQAIRHVWVNVLNPDHPNSESAAVAAHCAYQQGKFWEYHDLLFQKQADLSVALYNQIAQTLKLNVDLFQSCLGDPATQEFIRLNHAFAADLQVDATPYLFINTQPLSGEFTFETIDAIIKEELEK